MWLFDLEPIDLMMIMLIFIGMFLCLTTAILIKQLFSIQRFLKRKHEDVNDLKNLIKERENKIEISILNIELMIEELKREYKLDMANFQNGMLKYLYLNIIPPIPAISQTEESKTEEKKRKESERVNRWRQKKLLEKQSSPEEKQG